MDRILVGFDGSDHGHAALRFAIEEAKIRAAGLRVLCAWELPADNAGEFPPLEEILKKFREAAEEIVAEAAATVDELAPEVEVEGLVVEGRPGAALVENASGAIMVVVGTRGHGGFTGLLLGSVSQEVITHSEIPVVVVPSP